MEQKINRYTDEDGREIVYGYADEISAVTKDELEEWRDQKKLKETRLNNKREFISCYHDSSKQLSEMLSIVELGAIMKLIPYTKIGTGGELFVEGRRMTATDIARAIGKSKRPTDEIIKGLVSSEVLIGYREGRHVVYRVNEQFHTIGNHVRNARFTKVYKVKTRSDITKLSIQAAGLLYKMIPFYNFEWCVLCENPEERDQTKIKYLSHIKIADLLGVNRKFIDRHMLELIQNGFIAKCIVYRAELYAVNPDIMYRKFDEYTVHAEMLRGLFRMGEDADNQFRADISVDDLPF